MIKFEIFNWLNIFNQCLFYHWLSSLPITILSLVSNEFLFELKLHMEQWICLTGRLWSPFCSLCVLLHALLCRVLVWSVKYLPASPVCIFEGFKKSPSRIWHRHLGNIIPFIRLLIPETPYLNNIRISCLKF